MIIIKLFTEYVFCLSLSGNYGSHDNKTYDESFLTRAPMKINSAELSSLMIEIATEQFGSSMFKRRQLMDMTEQVIPQRGLWEPDDDELSGSFGTKSRGLANIDYRFSDLASRGELVSERRNYWRLASPKPPPARDFVQPPADIETPPDRIEVHVQRIIRDTTVSKSLKVHYDYKCQVCDLRIEPAPGSYYIEVHHVKPLGSSHSGIDTHGNMLVLCPNHHAMFDFGIPRFIAVNKISIDDRIHELTCKHNLTDDVMAYHNKHIHKRMA
jgi:hypothetical protein